MRAFISAVFIFASVSGVQAATIIDFDDQSAPPAFSQQTPLAEEYASLGVHFSGTGEVLNYNGNFGVSLGLPFTSPNFLAFNGDSGAFPPETISFDFLVTNFSLDFAGSAGHVILKGYLDGNLVETASLYSGSNFSWSTLTLAGSGFDQIIFDVSGTDNSFVVDNLTINAVPVPAAVWLFGSALAAFGWMRRKKAV